MRRLDTGGTTEDCLSETEARQLEEGLRILAKIIVRAVMKERSLKASSRYEERTSSTLHESQVRGERGPEKSPTLSVMETAKMLGLSRNSVYEAIRTGRIPSVRFGKRMFVPRVALDRMISGVDNYESHNRQRG